MTKNEKLLLKMLRGGIVAAQAATGEISANHSPREMLATWLWSMRTNPQTKTLMETAEKK